MIKSSGNLFEPPNPAMMARASDPHTSHLNAAAVVNSRKRWSKLNLQILDVLKKCSTDMTAKEIAYTINPENWLRTYMQVWKRMYLLVLYGDIEVVCERRSKVLDNNRLMQAYRIKRGTDSHDTKN